MLKMESDDVLIVAIWGVGGIGKTTIAKSIFNSIRNKFEASSFLADVKETCKTSHGVVTLQKQFLSNILMSETHNLDNYHQGIEVIRRKLCLQRILLILDDVDHVQQLKMLSVNRDLFRKGSKIIITTRNMSSLTSLQVDSVYSPAELNEVESLKLFSLHAFKLDHPKKAFWELSRKVVAYAEGLPLALEVFGSFFCDRSTAEWNDGLEKLKKHPHDDIQGKLKISFESLDKNDQELLLDIVFFFIGRDKYFTVKVLEDSECFAEFGIGELVRRSLVRVDEYNKLRMHNLLKDMAREIVCQESLKEPGERSRLRGHKEVLQVLRDCTGTKAIEGLCLELSELNDEHVNAVAFEKLQNLRLLHLNYLTHLKGTYVTTTRKLKWLCWHQFPLSSIPADLYMENVVAIDLQHSKLKQIWKGPKKLDKLRFLNLSHSQHLTKTPDFSGLKNLERLLLYGCTNLVEVHNSIGCLDKLLILNMANCKNLRNIPSSISMLTSLLVLNLSGTSRLYDQGGFKGPLSMFQQLLFAGPQKSVPISLASICGLSSCLQILNLSDCNMSYVPSEIGNLNSLLEVSLERNKFSTLPSSFSNLHNLQFLHLNYCPQLKALPNLPNNLKFLGASYCESLDTPTTVSQLGKVPYMIFDSSAKFNDNNFIRNILRLYQGHPVVALFLPGNEVPSSFQFQGIGSRLSFIAPPDVGEKIRGWIVCAVICNPYYINIRQEVINKTNGTTTYHPRNSNGQFTTFSVHGPGDIMWFHYVSSSRDGFNMEGGDEVDIVIFCYDSKGEEMEGSEVRCGISLIYERDDEDMEQRKESNADEDID